MSEKQTEEQARNAAVFQAMMTEQAAQRLAQALSDVRCQLTMLRERHTVRGFERICQRQHGLTKPMIKILMRKRKGA